MELIQKSDCNTPLKKKNKKKRRSGIGRIQRLAGEFEESRKQFFPTRTTLNILNCRLGEF